MRKTLTISGIECNFKSSAAIPRMYRLKFGRDIFVDMQKLQKQVYMQEKIKEGSGEVGESTLPIDSLEMFENIAFLMHRHGDPNQPSEIDDWLEQFETFSIYEVLPDILEMWGLRTSRCLLQKKRQRNRQRSKYRLVHASVCAMWYFYFRFRTSQHRNGK